MQTTACRDISFNLVKAVFQYLFRYDQCQVLTRNNYPEMQISNASFEAWRFMLIIGMDIMANNNDKATGYQKGKVRQKIYLNPPHYKATKKD